MASFLDVCRFNPTAGGTTDWTYSSAVTGYQSPTAAGAVNGATYRYRAESSDLSQWEIGYGAYNSGTGVFARSTVLFNSAGTTAKISFSAAPQVAIVALAEDLLVPKGQLFGCTLSTAGASSTFSVAAGQAADSTGIDLMTLASALSKTTAAWAVGTGNGSFDGTGSAPSATAGWYHVHLIKRPDTGVVDVLTSNSATAPTLPTNYTLFRRIGSIKTNGSFQWLAFTQYGDFFVPASATNEVNTTSPATTLTAVSLAGVPPGVSTTAFLRVVANSSVAGFGVLIANGDETMSLNGVTGDRTLTTQVAGAASSGPAFAVTSASNQIKYQVDTGATWNLFAIASSGYIDRRGRDA